MTRTLILCSAMLFGWLGLASVGQAQVFIRAPFVRVGVGDGVYVRAPFVNLYVPGDRYYYGPVYGPRVIVTQPAIVVPSTSPPAPTSEALPFPKPATPSTDAPLPIAPANVPTLDGFAKTFQAKAGSYDVTMLNPLTSQPTAVRFALPEGTPRRVIVNRNSIEWVYALRTWVRIEFDRDGAIVTSR